MSMHSKKVVYWFKVLSKFISIQLVIQILGFGSGILIIRVLSKQDYAYYLIANAMQTTINLMSDLGVTIGLTSIGGQIYDNKSSLSQLISTAFAVRRRLIMIAILLITPILIWMLVNKGASIGYSLLLVLVILIELHFYLSNKILITVPRLQSEFQKVQLFDFIGVFLRLVGLSFAYFTWLNAVIAAFTSTIASGIQNFFVIRETKQSLLVNAPTNLEYESKIWDLVKSQFLTTSFYCMQGQITIWLISIFGKTTAIAEVGALSKLAVIFTIITPILNTIITPMYSKQTSKIILQSIYIQIIGLFLLFGTFIISIVIFFPTQILGILGSQYDQLESEVLLIALTGLLSSLSMIIWSLNCAKAWVDQSWLIIPTTIGLQILLLIFLDISTVKGVLYFSLFSGIPLLIVNFYMTYKGLKLIYPS